MKRQIKLTAVILICATSLIFAQESISLRERITQIIEGKDAIVGIAVEGYDGKDTLSINGSKRFPMQSVFKFHIALAVLNEVDKGELNLNQKITITKEDLIPDLYSPIRDKYPNGTTMKLSEILTYTVGESDNVGCDILLKLIGGPQVVEKYLHSKNIDDVAIIYNEKDQQSNWENQFQNWTTPHSANQTLIKYYENKNNLLSKRSYDFLWKTMEGSKTGKKSIRGELPKNSVVAHKTGHSGKNKNGITAAVNDIRIVFLPNGKYFYLTVFVSNSKEDEEINQKIIAEVSRASWDYFIKK
ncbi:class A beta-lactamase [bacterium BRH_c32]|nr:MAG: class A beta-lactamase [bacterium BRH_c32]